MIIKIHNARLAFCQGLFEATSVNAGDKPRFSSTLLLPKDDAQIAGIKAHINSTAVEKWGNKAAVILKDLERTDKLFLHDGDNKSQYDGFPGNIYISAANKTAPKVFDKDKSELTKADGRPYAGCLVDASIDIWAQDNQFGKRINATLRGVQFRSDGDAFVRSAPASENDFDDLSNLGENNLV
jgi:hypothetical protein